MTPHTYVSRAGEKLAYALENFHFVVSGLICADFGSSTGGFVDCLLKNGAKKVYAIDTAYGEFAWTLRNDQRVTVLEKTNAMHVMLPEKVDLITNDTSWTKQEKIFPNILTQLKDNGCIITLIKPHYEAPKNLLKNGVLDPIDAKRIAQHTLDFLVNNFPVVTKGFCKSPILGGKGGNEEYIAYLQKQQA